MNNRGLYVHNAEAITKASTGLKSGHICTSINRHVVPTSVQPSVDASMEMDSFFNMPMIPMQNNGDEITTPCVLGIQVKPKAKHYQNSVRLLQF